MILCPNCQHHEITGALHCSECGSQLTDIVDDSIRTAQYKLDEISTPTADNIWPIKHPSSQTGRVNELGLFLLRDEQLISLEGKSEYTIGRVTDDQEVVPDVDLAPYGGYDYGVSRLHATITVGEQVTIKDLDSINGTHVNGRKIQPRLNHSLVHGDMLVLGTLKIRVIIRN
jgi:pSer/pThr/pTyr-binding forkhead associated (FHA) protein